MGYSKSCSKMEAESNTGLSQKMRKISNKPPNFKFIGTRKRKSLKFLKYYIQGLKIIQNFDFLAVSI